MGGTRQGVLSMCVYVCMCAGKSMCPGMCVEGCVWRDVCGGMCVEGGHVYVCVEGGKNDAAMRLKVYTALLLLTDGGYYSEIRHHVYILICITILTTGLKEQDSTLIPRSHGAR